MSSSPLPSRAAAPLPQRPGPPRPVSLAVLARLIGAVDAPEGTVTGITHRAQDVQPGDLFAALPGARAHGADFAAEAVARGAVAVLTDDIGATRASQAGVALLLHRHPRAVLGAVAGAVYGEPSTRLAVLGITGTSGKTTTAYLVEAALRAAGGNPGLIGTVETRLGDRVLASAFTTPEAPDLQALLAVMEQEGADSVVMEVSSHALALGRAEGTRFAVGGFTNLSHEHLDFHDGMDDYFRAKARLFDPAEEIHAAHAVVCVDDPWGVRMAELAGPGTVTVSATGRDATFSAHQIEADATGAQHFTVRGPGSFTGPARLRLPGAYNVANALLAVALVAQVRPGSVAAALQALAEVGVPGRMEQVHRGQDFLAVVDYAHKPAALEAVIAALREQSSGRVAVVVGAGGDRDTAKRPLMGQVAARLADLLVVTDDNPRTEDPGAIRAALVAGASAVDTADRAEVREDGDRAAAIAAAVAWARTGDVVLVAGKGHEAGQEVHGVKHPFDDRSVLGAAVDTVWRDGGRR